MKIIKITVLVAVVFSSGFFGGCKKKDEDLFKADVQNMMRESALTQAAVDDILKVAENILMNNSNAKIETAGMPLGCITSVDTVVTGPGSKTYTINFPLSCTSYDGKLRSGQMIVELSGTNYNTSGSSITIRFNNFFINYNQFQGKIVSTNLGNGDFRIVVSDEAGTGSANLYLALLGKYTFWKSTHKRSIYEGNADMIMINNKYKITSFDAGIYTFEGITTDGKNYYGNVISNLILDYSCTAAGNLRYPTAGVIEYKMDDKTKAVEYGDGSCDFMVVMSAQGKTSSFSLY